MDIIDEAFETIDRANFLPKRAQNFAYIDAPLDIGYGQTNSQPTTVRMMLEWLDAKPGQKILDIGSGSGWTTALLAHIAGKKGKVYAVEVVPDLVEFGRNNVERIGITNAEVHNAGTVFGLREQAPYDRILVSASAQTLPNELLDQLKVGGKLIIPVKNDILEISKTGKNTCKSVTHPGFVFVPLV